MPVYLCQPGVTFSEPWRHGIQVYAAPFELVDLPEATVRNEPTADNLNATADGVVGTNAVDEANAVPANIRAGHGGTAPLPTFRTSPTLPGSSTSSQQTIDVTGAEGPVHLSRTAQSGHEIRRIRHSEVVLVDDVCMAYGRHWLRLRWPGHKGGFSGYIALGKVSEPMPQQISNSLLGSSLSDLEAIDIIDSYSSAVNNPIKVETSSGQSFEEELRDGNDEEPQDNASTLSSEPFESNSSLICLRTGLIFPTSVAMKLLANYDDGLAPPVISAPLPSEPVFCRICREGLHDDADDEQPSPTIDNDDDVGTPSRGLSNSPTASFGDVGNDINDGGDDPAEVREPMDSEPSTAMLFKGPVQPNPTYHPNNHASDNPMLAPCECSGSMAFVHFMCLEQWRCRSRHPEARAGLHCETCGKPYALPPPIARPAVSNAMDHEDWLDAMPPHVMNALRQPHIWWQIGASIVRRRYLRPIAPVVMSPIVALYCRARRLLKKKGVARRRWACSLCRRRARWKCVRCLRSYYCSRQCQNVSWHIVHKHVCFKPSRYFCSLVVYGIATALLFPGMLRDPIAYDAGLGFIPVSFYIMAVLGGGIATLLKKSVGLDLRGRSFELVVVAGTVELVRLLWGLLGAFLGNPDSCLGIMGGMDLKNQNGNAVAVLQGVEWFLLKPAERWFLMWDSLGVRSLPWVHRILCIPNQTHGCFEYSHKAKSNFLFENETEGRCASDSLVVLSFLLATVIVAVANTMWKRHDRQRRVRRPRVHQD